MPETPLPALNPDELRAYVPPQTYTRGLEYAARRLVRDIVWDAEEATLAGRVHGRSARPYETFVHYVGDDVRYLRFGEGFCDCPVGYNCKHVVALVVTTRLQRTAEPPKPPSWEDTLRDMLPKPKTGRPLALRLQLSGHREPELHAQVLTLGKKNWIADGLTWNKLATQGQAGFVPAQLDALRTFYHLYKRQAKPRGEVKTIGLSGFDGQLLVRLFEILTAAGVKLLNGQSGNEPRFKAAEIRLDVTDDAGALTMKPVVRVPGELRPIIPMHFLGKDGRGLVYTDIDQPQLEGDPAWWLIGLATFDTAVPESLQQLVLDKEKLEIPAADADRFRSEFYPGLRDIAKFSSPDGSFEPPSIPEPRLVLRAAYEAGHQVDIGWEWAYDVDDTVRRLPLGGGGDDGYRDRAKENAILAALEGQAKPGPDQRLTGLDTMRFSTESLPLLKRFPGLDLEIEGEVPDYREATDSVVIAVSTAAVAGQTDWFDLGVTVTVEGEDVPLPDLIRALVAKDTHLLLPSGAYIALQKTDMISLRELIKEASSLSEKQNGPLRISRYQIGLWDELTALGVVGKQADAWRKQLEALRSIGAVDTVAAPKSLKAELRPYQLEGFQWLRFLWEHRLGGILADDMGLGKTVQTLALFCHARFAHASKKATAPFLVIAPASVVPGWASEAARFAPDLKVVTLGKRGELRPEVIGDADVVVTSYNLFRLDFDAYEELPWSILVLDEAQFVKNHQSKAHQCARRLAAPVKVAITGTPMENNLMELWSLLSITAPGLFPSPAQFEQVYAWPIEKQGRTAMLGQLRRRLAPVLKRRTKEQVATELPAKQEQVLEVELHPRHRKIYRAHLQRERQKVLGLIDDVDRNRFTILRSLTKLRQLSLHAGLVDEEQGETPSAKIDSLLEHLRDVVDGGHRALVFSQFTGFLKLVRDRLAEDGVEYCYLDGRTRNRAAAIDGFKAGTAPVFLISLKAGGFGLNLTEADYCFLLDPWWNPATEAQAVDRTHRIGQTRNVMVYRLIAKDTIEEKVMALKQRKAELFASVMDDDGGAFGSALNAEDIRGLFT